MLSTREVSPALISRKDARLWNERLFKDYSNSNAIALPGYGSGANTRVSWMVAI